MDAGEACDDGNHAAEDCCTPDCRLVQDGSVCDDGDPCTRFAACNSAGRCIGLGCDSGASCSPAGSSEVLSCGVTSDRCACTAISLPRLPSCAIETRIGDEDVLAAAVARLKQKGFWIDDENAPGLFAPALIEAAQLLECDPSDWVQPSKAAP